MLVKVLKYRQEGFCLQAHLHFYYKDLGFTKEGFLPFGLYYDLHRFDELMVDLAEISNINKKTHTDKLRRLISSLSSVALSSMSDKKQAMIAYDQDKAISGIQSLKKKIEELHNEFDVFSSPWRSFITRSKYRHEELGFSADLAANDRKPSYSDSEETPIARLHTLSSELEWLAQHMDHVRYEIENIYEIKNGSCFVRHENGKTVFWSSPVASRSLPENDVVARNLLQFWKFALN